MSRRSVFLSAILFAFALGSIGACTSRYIVDTEHLALARADVEREPRKPVFLTVTDARSGRSTNLDVRSLRGGALSRGEWAQVSVTSRAKPALIASGAILAVSGVILTIIGSNIVSQPTCEERFREKEPDPNEFMSGFCMDLQGVGWAMLIPGVLTVVGGTAMMISGGLIGPSTSPVPHYGRPYRPAGYGARLQGTF